MAASKNQHRMAGDNKLAGESYLRRRDAHLPPNLVWLSNMWRLKTQTGVTIGITRGTINYREISTLREAGAVMSRPVWLAGVSSSGAAAAGVVAR